MQKKYKFRKDFTYGGRRYTVKADTKKDLELKYIDKMNELRSGRRASAEDITLEQWGRICIDTYKQNQSEATKERFLNRINHCIFVPLGNIQLRKITPLDLQRLINLQEGKSATQIKEVYSAITLFFSRAYVNGYIPVDPSVGLIKPKAKPPKKRRALTSDERELIEKVGSKDRRFYVFLLMLYCGCRPLEAENVKASDIAIIENKPILHIRGTKTANSDRYVPIPNKFYELIKDIPEDEYIAINSYGNHISHQNRYRLWSWFTRELNLSSGAKTYRNKIVVATFDESLTPYSLRHEYCTNLARQGVDVRIAQKLMGHSTIAITANIYTHIGMDDILLASDIINKNQ